MSSHVFLSTLKNLGVGVSAVERARLTDIRVAEGVLRVRERARASLQLVHAQAAEHEQQAEQLVAGFHLLLLRLYIFYSRRVSYRLLFFFSLSLSLSNCDPDCKCARVCSSLSAVCERERAPLQL